MELTAVASAADRAALAVAGARSRLSAVGPAAVALGAGTTGALGDLGGVLAGQVNALIDARTREIGAVADEASALATTLDAATLGYRAAESNVVARHATGAPTQAVASLTPLASGPSTDSQAALGVLGSGAPSSARAVSSSAPLDALAPGLASPGSTTGAS